tara:strand:- start:263 stop:1300 length:1038 start_codon:yes stop_codon:yes gene_type:complete
MHTTVPLRGKLSQYCTGKYSQLAEKGWMIVDVCPEARAYELNNSLRQDLAIFNPEIEPNDVSTWTRESMPLDHTIFGNYASGLWPSVWESRMETKHVWKELYNTEHLLSSCDAFSIAIPSYQHNTEKRKDINGFETWLHRDQEFANTSAADSIQGCFALSNVSGADYSTVVLEPIGMNTQELCDLFYETFKNHKRKKTHDENWCVFSQEERDWFASKCKRVKTTLKAGQMILWLSTTPHCGGCNKLPESQMQYNTRIATYVAMIPKSIVCANEINARKKIFKEKLTTTSHLPVVPGKRSGTFKKRTKTYLPQLWGKPAPIRFPPVVSNYETATGRVYDYSKIIGF